MKISVEVSARHIHLSLEDAETLFGKNYNFTVKKELSQPGQFAYEERVTISGPKGEIPGVIVLGPCRKHTQVELSLTDCIKIGVSGIIRESGDLIGSSGCTVRGPKGKCNLGYGLIVAKRHIHMTPADAEKLQAKDKSMIKVKINSMGRSLIFDDVILRVSENFSTAMHIDTDEANAINYAPGIFGEII